MKRSVHEDSIEFLNGAMGEPINRSGIAIADMDAINDRWAAVGEAIANVVVALTRGDAELAQHETKIRELETWLAQAKDFLKVHPFLSKIPPYMHLPVILRRKSLRTVMWRG